MASVEASAIPQAVFVSIALVMAIASRYWRNIDMMLPVFSVRGQVKLQPSLDARNVMGAEPLGGMVVGARLHLTTCAR